jgi:hypothetical protein
MQATPEASNATLACPWSYLMMPSINWKPNRRRLGAATGGPPLKASPHPSRPSEASSLLNVFEREARIKQVTAGGATPFGPPERCPPDGSARAGIKVGCCPSKVDSVL